MKKQYIQTETTVMIIDTQKHLMAGSNFSENLKEEEVSNETEGFVQASRGNSIWGDDEE